MPERVASSFALSIAIDASLGLGLNHFGFAVRPFDQVLSIGLFTLFWIAVAMVRNQSVTVQSSSRLVLIGGLVLLTVPVMLGIAARVVEPTPMSGSISLYVVDEGGTVADYPRTAKLGESVSVTVGIDSHDDSVRSLDLTSPAGQVTHLTLQPNQSWRATQEFKPAKTGVQEVSWQLTSTDQRSPIRRQVHLWVTAS
jgi:uncharacterized membrane protein